MGILDLLLILKYMVVRIKNQRRVERIKIFQVRMDILIQKTFCEKALMTLEVTQGKHYEKEPKSQIKHSNRRLSIEENREYKQTKKQILENINLYLLVQL